MGDVKPSLHKYETAFVFAILKFTVDFLGNLYIADTDNHRIRIVTNVGQMCINRFVNNNEHINIYPNPNNGSFIIESNSAKKQTVQIYDLTGKLVLTEIINGRTTIDGSMLNEGVYSISINSDEGVITKRLVIVR